MIDLDRLIDSVEAGSATMNHFAAAFPSETAYGKTTWGTAHNAFSGDMNAALALMKALLPGWVWGRTPQGLMWIHRAGTGFFSQCGDGIPSRALLLAVLKAYRETRG